MNDKSTPTNPGRRRLARGGLAVPVVLASLTSKNAFAALPYACFVSGQLPGNMSPFGPNPTGELTPDCPLPRSRSSVQTGLQTDSRAFVSVFQEIKIFVNNKSLLTVSVGASATPRPPATLFQVLTLQNANGDNAVPKLELLKQAVVIYRNAELLPPPNALVPLTTDQVVSLTQAAYANRSVDVKTLGNETKTFTTAQIQTYFDQLSVSA